MPRRGAISPPKTRASHVHYIVKALIEHEDNIPVNLTDSQNDSVLDTVGENEFESLINFSNPTARLVVKTETGTYRVYNQSKVVQLKNYIADAVKHEFIRMYLDVCEYLSGLCAASGFGDKVIDEVAAYIAEHNPRVKGFNRRGLYRMKQFYETYKDDEFVTSLVTQISWTNHPRID